MFIGFHFSKYLLFVMIVWGSLVVVVDGGVAFSMFKHKTQKKIEIKCAFSVFFEAFIWCSNKIKTD